MLGLVMIVRDEEAVIERALRSVLSCIKTYVIVDTGSTDRTLDIARDVLCDISGLIVSRPWVDFGKNRTEALTLCESRMDWALMLDADDNMVGVPPVLDENDADGIVVHIQHGHIMHQRIQVFRMGRGWHYVGRVHEMPESSSPNPKLVTWPSDTYMVSRCDGFRSRDPAKFLKDAAILATEPPTQRNLFFLAQSYRDAGLIDAAIYVYENYMKNSSESSQERYMVCVNLIVLIKDPVRQLALAWEAIELCPWRLEAPFTLLERRRNAGLQPTRQIYAMATSVTNRVPRETDNFVTPAVYAWGFDNEVAFVAFALGHFDVAYDALLRCMLNAPTIELQESARKNAKRAMAALSNEA